MNEKELGDAQVIARSVLERIERECIAPRPRWHFLVQESVIISLGICSVLVGSLAVAGMLFEMRNTWWNFYTATHATFFDFVLDSLPYAWGIALLLFACTAYLSVRHTKRGYRYPVHIIVGSSVLVSGVAGVCIYVAGIGSFVDEKVGHFVPFHVSLVDHEKKMWHALEKGRMAGVVREISTVEPVVWIENIEGIPVRIDMVGFAPEERALMRIGEIVRIMGVPTTTQGALHGCAFFMLPNDVLHRAHISTQTLLRTGAMQEYADERNIVLSRSNECKGVESFARLQEHSK